MKKFNLIIVGLLLLSLARGQTVSPELISSCGDSFSNAGYQLDWSLGECVIITHSAGGYVLTQGFHQTNYETVLLEELPDAGVNISVYPNPTTDFITLNATPEKSTEFYGLITITDTHGKVLLNKEIYKGEEQFDFCGYAAGVYFLAVRSENKLIKNFKIIKR